MIAEPQVCAVCRGGLVSPFSAEERAVLDSAQIYLRRGLDLLR